MGYCNNLNIAEIEKLSQEQISKQLDKCKKQCNRYTECATVAYMNDILSYSKNCSKCITQDDILTNLSIDDCTYNCESCDHTCNESIQCPLYNLMYDIAHGVITNE